MKDSFIVCKFLSFGRSANSTARFGTPFAHTVFRRYENMKRKNQPKYIVLECGEWLRVKRGEPQKSGWLHYELRDGTNGLARPGNWGIEPAVSI